MAALPTHIAQTSREVKKEYKRHGPRFSEAEQRQLERALKLDQRATKAREQEERRKTAKTKREERERKERQARKQLGMGLATQLIGYSHTQKKMRNGMEAFLGLRSRDKEEKREEEGFRKKLEQVTDTMEKEPLDNSDGDDAELDLSVLDKQSSGDQWIDDDLDDDVLLEAHDLAMSDTVEGMLELVPDPQPPTPKSPVSKSFKPVTPKEDVDFLRLHGPINKTIDDALGGLPGPLIELLSQDISTNLSYWNPAPSLLHKLNPTPLPPHRLRIKAGCTVTLLRDLNTTSKLLKSSQLRILRVETERLECIVLDGQLEGSNAVLTRVPFSAKYRNEAHYSFQRKQFPIRVSTDVDYQPTPRNTLQDGFRMPSVLGRTTRPLRSFKSAKPISKAMPLSDLSASFKLPRLPASRIMDSPAPHKPDTLVTPLFPDGWDDFLDSQTQIARELSSDNTVLQDKHATHANSIMLFSTQELDFSLSDLEDTKPHSPLQIPPSMSHKKSPRRLPWLNGRSNVQTSTFSPSRPSQDLKPKSAMPPALAPPKQLTLKRKPSSDAAIKSLIKKPAFQQSKPGIAPIKSHSPKSLGSFSEFGLSTQDVTAMLNSDETIWSSPPIVV